jgi:hypothetical protein
VSYGLSVASENQQEDGVGTSNHQDLASYFTWKQVGLRFSYLASSLVEAWCKWCTSHNRGGCVKDKLKTDGSMRQAASDPTTLTLLFSMY